MTITTARQIATQYTVKNVDTCALWHKAAIVDELIETLAKSRNVDDNAQAADTEALNYSHYVRVHDVDPAY